MKARDAGRGPERRVSARMVQAFPQERVTDPALIGEDAVSDHTRLIAASNRRAKAQLGFKPRRLLWKGGAAFTR